MSISISKVWPIIIIALATTACADRGSKPSYSPPALGAAPVSGLPTLEDVKVTAINETVFRFETTAAPDVGMTEVLAVLYCKADSYRLENGFDAWGVEQIQRSSLSSGQGSQAILAVIKLAKAPVPADFKAVSKDWCAEMK